MSRFQGSRGSGVVNSKNSSKLPLILFVLCGAFFTFSILSGGEQSGGSTAMGGGISAAAVSSTNTYLNNQVASPKTKRWDSSKSVVIGLGSGYQLKTYQVFVGSLKSTGYKGHIILGIAPDAPQDVLDYLREKNVKTYDVKLGPCTAWGKPQGLVNNEPSRLTGCSIHYPQYKLVWGRFALVRDWLQECKECTDGVLFTDVRDVFFQSDPFVYVEEPKPLMVFEEIYPNVTTQLWLTRPPVNACRQTKIFDDPLPMLCSGSIMGSRQGFLDYCNTMVEEFDYWNEHDRCRQDIPDDQAHHNYVYYANKIKGGVAFKHRTGPIQIIGIQAANMFRHMINKMIDQRLVKDEAEARTYIHKNGFRMPQNVTGKHHFREWFGDWATDGLVDSAGRILNLDGRPSPQVHQVDRFGNWFMEYLHHMGQEVWN